MGKFIRQRPLDICSYTKECQGDTKLDISLNKKIEIFRDFGILFRKLFFESCHNLFYGYVLHVFFAFCVRDFLSLVVIVSLEYYFNVFSSKVVGVEKVCAV